MAPASSSATSTPRVVPPVAAARAVQAYLARLGVPRAEVGGLIARVPRLLARHLDGPAGLEACVAALSGVDGDGAAGLPQVPLQGGLLVADEGHRTGPELVEERRIVLDGQFGPPVAGLGADLGDHRAGVGAQVALGLADEGDARAHVPYPVSP
jgi:hypothetical protein